MRSVRAFGCLLALTFALSQMTAPPAAHAGFFSKLKAWFTGKSSQKKSKKLPSTNVVDSGAKNRARYNQWAQIDPNDYSNPQEVQRRKTAAMKKLSRHFTDRKKAETPSESAVAIAEPPSGGNETAL